MSEEQVSKYDYTTGTKILTTAAVFQFIAFVFSLLFEETGIFAVFIGGGLLCLLAAAYSAATDRTMQVSRQVGKFQPASTSDASAAFMFSIFSLMFNALLTIIYLLSEISDSNLTLTVVLILITGIFTIIGGYAGNKEWNNETLGEAYADFRDYLDRKRFQRRHRRH